MAKNKSQSGSNYQAEDCHDSMGGQNEKTKQANKPRQTEKPKQTTVKEKTDWQVSSSVCGSTTAASCRARRMMCRPTERWVKWLMN